MSNVYVPIIENATVTYYYNANNILRYIITANSGYVLYSQREYDEIVYAIESGDLMGDVMDYLTFSREKYVGATHNFDDVKTILESEVPADSIFGGGNDDNHEVM